MRYLILFFCSFLCFSSYATKIKIGFIDTNHVITNLTKYKSSIDLISTDFEPKKQELLDLYNHIELLRSKINLSKKSKSNELIEAELSKLLKLEQSFKKETEFWQSSMNKQKIELLKEIELIVNQTIDEYATRENYDLILYDNVAFVSDKVDISKEIIDEIEKL